MTRRRFYAPPEAFAPDGRSAKIGPEETRHLRNVLRLQTGDEVFLFDGEGKELQCRVQSISRDSTDVTVIRQVEVAQPESYLDLTLAVALLKGEKFDLVIQKATELGVTRLIPVMTARADVRIKSDDDAKRKMMRWQRIALEATKQSGRAWLMKIETPTMFSNLVRGDTDSIDRVQASGNAGASGSDAMPLPNVRIMFAESQGASLAKALDDRNGPLAVTAITGPEGGWTDDEIEQARAAGWWIVTLGGRILRAETAAIVVAALIQHHFGDLK